MHISEIVISALKIQPQQHIIPLQKSPFVVSEEKNSKQICQQRANQDVLFISLATTTHKLRPRDVQSLDSHIK